MINQCKILIPLLIFPPKLLLIKPRNLLKIYLLVDQEEEVKVYYSVLTHFIEVSMFVYSNPDEWIMLCMKILGNVTIIASISPVSL
ncbi:hypothetical protein Avbf_03331 [Armadillidium vulgare]|nr:hypothetical protein Avbf_03331 [Armadillidium vulgare]